MKKLQKVLLYPCHGIRREAKYIHAKNHAWLSEEWWGETPENAYLDKRDRTHHFDSIDHAVNHYNNTNNPAHLEHINISTPTNIVAPQTANMIVTGSHTICDTCKKYTQQERQERKRTNVQSTTKTMQNLHLPTRKPTWSKNPRTSNSRPTRRIQRTQNLSPLRRRMLQRILGTA